MLIATAKMKVIFFWISTKCKKKLGKFEKWNDHAEWKCELINEVYCKKERHRERNREIDREKDRKTYISEYRERGTEKETER